LEEIKPLIFIVNKGQAQGLPNYEVRLKKVAELNWRAKFILPPFFRSKLECKIYFAALFSFQIGVQNLFCGLLGILMQTSLLSK
jgi:hypothetical protein